MNNRVEARPHRLPQNILRTDDIGFLQPGLIAQLIGKYTRTVHERITTAKRPLDIFSLGDIALDNLKLIERPTKGLQAPRQLARVPHQRPDGPALLQYLVYRVDTNQTSATCHKYFHLSGQRGHQVRDHINQQHTEHAYRGSFDQHTRQAPAIFRIIQSIVDWE